MEELIASQQTSSLTKAHLLQTLNSELGVNLREARDMVDCVFELLTAALVAGEEIKLSGFGNFNVRTKQPRLGRNPKTGASAPIPARRVVSFRASPALKDRLK